MNNLYTSNRAILSQLILGMALFGQSLYGITVNNTPLDKLLKPNQSLTFTPHTKDNVTSLEIQDGNIKIGSDDIAKLDNLKKVFEQVYQNKGGSFITKTLNMSSNTVDYNGSYLVGRENINILAKIALNLGDCVLESPNIALTGNQMNFVDCFLINPQTLDIIPHDAASNLEIIRITFNENITHPTLVTGRLNLKNETAKGLLFTNVKEVTVQFAPKAWGN